MGLSLEQYLKSILLLRHGKKIFNLIHSFLAVDEEGDARLQLGTKF
jgi:hypothetical protein